MAIGTDAAVEFYGTQVTLGTSTSAVTDGSFSDGTNDLIAFTNSDDAPQGDFVLAFTTATTGDAGSVINLYAVLIDIDGSTGDTEVPDSNFLNIYLGSFPHNNPSTSAQIARLRATLPNAKSGQVYNFYIENQTGQTISAGWELQATPVTIGPKA